MINLILPKFKDAADVCDAAGLQLLEAATQRYESTQGRQYASCQCDTGLVSHNVLYIVQDVCISDLMYTPKKGGRFPPSRGLGGGSRSGTPASSTRRPGSLLTPRLEGKNSFGGKFIDTQSSRGGSTPVSRPQVIETTGSHVAQVESGCF